ncbi:MAG TPA: non-homologous end-joining DNA ligase [bacterium]|nr:non-homologous end-joining DNA ligase [bacterium]
MLATLTGAPFTRPNWVYEEKYDGYRILAHKEGSRVRLLSRNALDRAGVYEDVARAVGALPSRTLLLDGEVVAFDRRGVSRFQLLQRGAAVPRYAVFDCLYRDGHDLQRRAARGAGGRVVGRSGTLMRARRLARDGYAAYRVARRRSYEGLVAKDLGAAYVEGWSAAWLKVKVRHEDEFVVVGYTAPRGSRAHFGALLLGAYEHGTLRYVGKVGTGFDAKSLAALFRKFQPLIQKTPAVADRPRERGVTYLAPRLVAQVAFDGWTADRRLRQPAFLGLRDDKAPTAVVLPEASA